MPRWRRLMREFRELAVELGGVLIKLGQFLSTRVDLFPPELLDELADLQDEVPAVPYDAIVARVEGDYGMPIADVFPYFSREPVGSASLAQVHKARLPSGEEVAVKVLRPGIAEIVETDLVVVARFLRRLERFDLVARYADLDRVASEFVSVTSRELDMTAEGQNAERFASDFAGDFRVRIPKVYWDYTTEHTLTMEDVAHIRVDDAAALEAVGIDPTDVARVLFDIYLTQIGRTYFVHCDPHPGNLFVQPLRDPEEALLSGIEAPEFGPDDPVPFYPDRPFRLVFVDFGMAVTIPKRLRGPLRDYIVGVGTQDARMIVESYLDAGILLPDADVDRVEALTEALLERHTGSLLGQMKDVDLGAYMRLYADYSEVLYESPMQVQADLLFVMRSLGILSGLITRLAPRFDPAGRVVEFAGELVREELQPKPKRITAAIPRLLKLPGRLENVLTRVNHGQLSLRTRLAPESAGLVRSVRRAVDRLALTVVAVGLFVAGVVWHQGSSLSAALTRGASEPDSTGVALMAAGAVVFAVSLFSGRGGK